MKKTKKAAKAVPAPSTKPAPSTPAQPGQEILAKLEVVKLITKTIQLLGVGTFQAPAFNDVVKCDSFLKEMHKSLLDDLLQHPEADLIPQLKAHKEQSNG